jgi:hypothetical protein
MNRLVTHGCKRRPDNAFGRHLKLPTSASVRRICYFAPVLRRERETREDSAA